MLVLTAAVQVLVIRVSVAANGFVICTARLAPAFVIAVRLKSGLTSSKSPPSRQSHPRRRTTRPRPAQRATGHSGESMTNTDYLILAAVLIGVALAEVELAELAERAR